MAAKAGSKQSKRVRSAPAPQSGDEPPLSLERIVATAVELLDADGVGGLTMRRLADHVGAGAMSLYWHVANKEAVFDLALDSVLEYGAPPPAATHQDWRDEIFHMLEDWRDRMLLHPWSASLLPRRALGPSILSRLELIGTSLTKAGIVEADLNVAIWSLWNYVMGATITRSSFGPSDEDRFSAQRRLAELNERYPTIGRSNLLLDSDWDATFRSGLAFLLEGLASRSLSPTVD